MFRPKALMGPCHLPSFAPPQCSPPTRSEIFSTTCCQSVVAASFTPFVWWHWSVPSERRTPTLVTLTALTQSRSSLTSLPLSDARSRQTPT